MNRLNAYLSYLVVFFVRKDALLCMSRSPNNTVHNKMLYHTNIHCDFFTSDNQVTEVR